jgi:hypothetical protein
MTRSVWAALACDAVIVLVFVAIGTADHGTSGKGIGHVALVALSFLVALGVGWLAARAWRGPAEPWPTGVAVWFATVVLGVVLRGLIVPGAGFGPTFWLVAGVFLGITMLGWRALDALRARRRA